MHAFMLNKKKFDLERVHMGVDMEKSFKTFYFSSLLNGHFSWETLGGSCLVGSQEVDIKSRELFYFTWYYLYVFEYWNWCEKWICINTQKKLVRLHKVVESTHFHLKFKFMGHPISMVFYFSKVQTFYQSLSEICKCQKHLRHIYLWSKVVCFVLFVTLRSPKPCCFMLQSWYLFRKL